MFDVTLIMKLNMSVVAAVA